MSKQVVYVLERLTNRKLQRWKPEVSCVRRPPVVAHKQKLLEAGFMEEELQIMEYERKRARGVER